ncbi:MAG: SDR family NAD(P)-dependent oxidoreductase [Acidobacteriota bacterium]
MNETMDHVPLVEISDASKVANNRDIAIIGMAGRFPGAKNLKEFWSQLEHGIEAMRTVSDEELLAAGVPRSRFSRPDYVKVASPLDGIDEFDADFFGYNAREAEIMDPQQRLFLEHAWSALEDAGHTPRTFDGLIGVYAGVAWNTYLLSNLIHHPELFEGAGGFQIFITNDKDFMPTRVAYKLDLKGPAMVVQTSCSTSLVATHLACLGLQSYECDMALVGGVTVRVPDLGGYVHQEGGLASPDGRCRPFDAAAAGTIFGSGVGVVVLKRLAEAVEDGDTIRAVIKGSAINNDGSMKVSYTAPSVEGQSEVIAAAQEMADIAPSTIRYIECHGTATALGDPIEIRALNKVFARSTSARGFCAIGSVKSNVGHLDAAAGIAGLIKTTLAIEHRKIPPTLHYEQANPAIDFASSPFYVAKELETWERNGTPRRAAVSSFGVGGTNAHVLLEEAPPAETVEPSRPWQLLTLSARSATALQQTSDNLRDHLLWDLGSSASATATHLADIAHTLRAGREVFRHRRFVLCRDHREASAALSGELPAQMHTSVDAADPRSRPVAFLFSGQGSQYPRMGRDLYDHEPIFRAAVDRCTERLAPSLGQDLRNILWPVDSESAEPKLADPASASLHSTRFTQPALFVLEVALAQLWMSWGVIPHAMLGHSIGELVAAHLAGVLSLDDALEAVAVRGQLMDDLPRGAMLAVPMSETMAGEHLARHPELSLAAVNELDRVVISGPVDAIDALAEELAGSELEGRRLHTSHAFHSAMMDGAVDAFVAEMRKLSLQPPEIPFISNVTGTWITAEAATDPEYWGQHLRSTVRFADGVATLMADPDRLLLEVGPGRTLAHLARRHPVRQPQQAVITSLRHPREPASGPTTDQAHMLAGLGRLWAAGLDLGSWALGVEEKRRRVPLPTYPFESRRYWIDGRSDALAEATVQGQSTPSEQAAAPTPGMPLQQRPDLADWFYLPSWKPTLAPSEHSEHSEHSEQPSTWLILAPDDLAQAFCTALDERQATGIAVGIGQPGKSLEIRERSREEHLAFRLDPAQQGVFDALVAALDQRDLIPRSIVFAWSLDGGLEAPAVTEAGAFEMAQLLGSRALLALVRSLVGRFGADGLQINVVADGLVHLGGDEPLRPEKAPLIGFSRVLPQELPGLTMRVIDTPRPATAEAALRLMQRLIAEESQSDHELIAYRGRRRYVEDFQALHLDIPSQSPLRPRGSYLLTGGLSGNGYALAQYLAREHQARLVLAEPSAPDAKVRSRLEALEALGGEVHLLAFDLVDAGAWQQALAQTLERCGSLHGILHTAGTVGEATFRTWNEIDDCHVAAHFEPKIHATLALAEALDAAPLEDLDFCLLLSSMASVLGGLAYGAYSAANRFLDAFAEDRAHRSSLPWLSLRWDVWQLEDESVQITDLRSDLAELGMTRRQGEEAFERVLSAGMDGIMVSTADLQHRLLERRQRIESRRPNARERGVRHPRPDLGTPYAAPASPLEQRIAEVWQELLGFEDIGLDDNFFELGGDSFVAVRAAARLREVLEIDLPVAQLFRRVTVRSLAELLDRDQSQENALRAQQLAERRASKAKRRELLRAKRARKQKAEVGTR